MTDEQEEFEFRLRLEQENGGPAATKPARSASYDAGAKARPVLRDTISQLQGPAFGFLDEVAGAVGGGAKALFSDKPFRQGYEETRDFVRGADDAGMRANPVRNMAGQMALTAPLGLFGAAKLGGGPLSQYLASIGIGGVAGGVAGLGTSTAQTPGGMAKDAATSAAIAMALPAVLQPAAKATGAVVGTAASAFNKSGADDYAKRKVAEAFVRDAPKSNTPMQQAGARMARLGPEARVVDTGGSSVRGTLDTLATLPGETKNSVETAIRSRQSTRADRMIGEAERAFGTGGIRMAPTMDEWMAQRAKDAAPLYQKLHKMDLPANGDLAEIVAVAERNGFASLARKIADYDRVPFTLGDKALAQSGQFSARDLDYLKRAMDSQIPKLRDLQTGAATAEGRALIGLRDTLVKRMDDMTGGFYAQARNAWAGPSQLMDASTAGRAVLNKDDATIKTMMAGMGASEKDAFALGAFEALRAKLGARAGQTQIIELWREKGLQEKLKAIFGDERAYREFASKVAAEGRMKGLESVGRGSQTAARQYAAGDLDVSAGISAGQALMDAKTGNVPSLLNRAANAWNRVSTPEPVRDAMGRMLLSQGADGRQTLQNIQQAAAQVAAARRAQAAQMGFAAAPVGGAAYNALLMQQLERDTNPLGNKLLN